MTLTYDIIERLCLDIPGYNERPLCLSDFEALCAREGIVTFEHRMPSRGWYFVKEGVPFIIINKRLSVGHKAFVGFHEYFHHRFHPAGHHHYLRIGMKDRVEREASTMAAVAIIPTRVLARDLEDGRNIEEKYDIPKYLAEFRIRVWQDFRQLRMFRDV
jgi:Zn-dependent peptidase ImmA (M78 family)